MVTDTFLGPGISWDSGSNWSTGTVPGPTDVAIIPPVPYITEVIVGDNDSTDNQKVGSLSTSMGLQIAPDATLTVVNSLDIVGTQIILLDENSEFIVAPGATFANNNNGVLTGVIFQIQPHSILSLPGDPISTLDDSSIELAGLQSDIETNNGSGDVSLEQSLTEISSGSELSTYRRNYTTSNAIINDGSISITDGTFSSGLLTSSGTIAIADGDIASSIYSTGFVDVSSESTGFYGITGKRVFSGAADTFMQTTMKGTAVFSGGTVSFPDLRLMSGGPTIAGADVSFGRTALIRDLTMTSGALTLGPAKVRDLILSGVTLSGGAVNGAGVVNLVGAAALSGVTLGGAITYNNVGSITQSGGDVVLGDSSGVAAKFNNKAAGVYLLADDSGIGLGASPKSAFDNEGLFEKTGSGGGRSVIAPETVDNGTITAASGTLDFTNEVFGQGALNVESDSALEFGGFVVPSLTLSFSGSNGELILDDAQDFHAVIDGFAANQTIDLTGFSLAGDQFKYTPSSGGTDGYLLLASGSASANLHFAGPYQTSDFHLATDTHGGTLVTLVSSI